MDTVADKLVSMLMSRLDGTFTARRVERELWALTPPLHAVNAKPDLVANIGRAIAEGLRALSPPPP